MRVQLPILLGLLALTFAVYLPVRGFDFVDYDDHLYVVENANLRAGPSLESAAGAFERLEANWIPLTRLSLQLDHALFGLDAGAYHLTNVVLHALSTLLLFLFLARTTGSPWPSAFTAAVFAVHPLHVESVAWVSERKDVLSGLFFMLALLAWSGAGDRPGRARMAAVASCLLLGLLAKPMLVTLPFVLLLLDVWPLGRLRLEPGRAGLARLRVRVLEKWPLFAIVAGFCAATLAAQSRGGAMEFGERLPFDVRAANAVESLVVYLAQTVWPAGLAVFYPHPGQVGPAWRLGGAVLLLTGVTAAAWRLRDRLPALLVGWLWYVGMLVPVVGLVQVGLQGHADRYMYLPLAGLSLAVTWGGVALAGSSRTAQRALCGVGAGVVAALAVAAHAQLGHWRDTLALFTRAAAVTDHNFVAEHGLAKEWMQRGDLAAAENHARAALAMRPGWSEARLALADVKIARGQVDAAMSEYQSVLRSDPDDERAAGKLGLAFVRLGRFDEARPLLSRALAVHEGSPELHVGMALAAAGGGDFDAALHHGRLALRLDPDLVPAANNLAWLLATCPDPDVRDGAEAIRLARHALDRSGGESPGILDTLAAGQAAAGRYAEAEATARRAAALARARGAGELAAQILERARLYASGRGYVE